MQSSLILEDSCWFLQDPEKVGSEMEISAAQLMENTD